MSLYNFKDQSLENIIDCVQSFTNTEFIIINIIKEIANDAYEISVQHEDEFLRNPRIDEINVYDELERRYDGVVEGSLKNIALIQEQEYVTISETERKILTEKENINQAFVQVYNLILELTVSINTIVKEAIIEKQKRQHTNQIFYRSVQVFPFVKHRLSNDEYSYNSIKVLEA